MQEETSPNLHFFHRTEALAKKLGCTIKELEGPLGVSWRTIISARKDGGPLTNKTWRKLEAAERRAGISAVDAEQRRLGMIPIDPVMPSPDDHQGVCRWIAEIVYGYPQRVDNYWEQLQSSLENTTVYEHFQSFGNKVILKKMWDDRERMCQFAPEYLALLKEQDAPSETIHVLEKIIEDYNLHPEWLREVKKATR